MVTSLYVLSLFFQAVLLELEDGLDDVMWCFLCDVCGLDPLQSLEKLLCDEDLWSVLSVVISASVSVVIYAVMCRSVIWPGVAPSQITPTVTPVSMTVGVGPQSVESMSVLTVMATVPVSMVMATVPVFMVMARGRSIMASCVRIGIALSAGVPDGGILSGQSAATWPYSSQSKHFMWGQWHAIWPNSWHWKHLSSSLDITFTEDKGISVVVNCCAAWRFSTVMASANFVVPSHKFLLPKCMHSYAIFEYPNCGCIIIEFAPTSFFLKAVYINCQWFIFLLLYVHKTTNRYVFIWIAILQFCRWRESLISSQVLFEVKASDINVLMSLFDFAHAN